ncbi:tetratricopeptide repeat protein [Alkalibacillus aidingensis]|uniref:tetratricopeptide repeat protein n=1 Tax=Alkalibacillus aidingensis TaxID=2747607 RepID=UPI0016605A78|nr:tetratricopeptide repeat protein [Alkalibacillus aidingensis]
MSLERHDIVMFPGWRKDLEQKAFDAITQKNFEEALLHIKKLEEFNEAHSEIITAKTIALVELGRYDEAIGLCRQLMKEDEDNYYKYLHIYLSILFQNSQYTELIDLLDEVFETETVPPEYREVFMQLHNLSKDMRTSQPEQEAETHISHFFDSLEHGNFQEQWKLLSIHRRNNIEPYLKGLIPYLSDARLNPVIKTGILLWLVEQGVDEAIEVEKFGNSDYITPAELNDVMETGFAKKVLSCLEDVEQEDPTLFEFTKQILYRFLYIKFPQTPGDEEVVDISEAVLLLARKYLQLNHSKIIESQASDNQKNWMEEIEHLEKIYYSQIGE